MDKNLFWSLPFLTQQRFREADTEAYFDNSDNQYRILWNPDGSKHWGYFDDLENSCRYEDFLRASDRWNEYMLEMSHILTDSQVLDIGCGNGNVSVWLAQQTGCEALGIDISRMHIRNAQAQAQQHPSLKLSFKKASATHLPFPDSSFTHVWSQGTLCHIQERDVVLREIYRVLKKEGIFIFDDLVTPASKISKATQSQFYDRLFISQAFSPESYLNNLAQVGFKVLEAKNLSQHMKKCYEIQAERIAKQDLERSLAYQQSVTAIDNDEIGWWFYLCKKESNTTDAT
ncbi:MAG: methyltransferase domain-containing protein [Moorea sp. SIO2B7]|nr:methyltransferase domain-containing protein [Moorena sp. SIO2B7]